MSSLLVVYEGEVPTVSILKESLPLLFETGVRPVFSRSIDVKPQMIDCADVVMLIRPMDICSWSVAKAAKMAGAFLVFFTDDDLLHMPEDYPHIPWRIQSMRSALSVSGTVLSSSADIRERYGPKCRGGRNGVIHTIVTAEELSSVPKGISPGQTKIVYAAGRDHAGLFHSLVEPILSQLDKRYGRKVSLTFVGVHPDIDTDKYSFQIQYQKSMPLQEYREYMRREHFDIGLAPLHDDSVSACKYFNKYIEYTLVGTVGVYSNCRPYTDVVRNGVNGFLADNTKDGWYQAICRAIDEPVILQECLSNAIRYLKEEHSTEKIRTQLFKDIPELRKKRRHKRRCRSLIFGKILYRLFRMGDILYLFFFYLKRHEVKAWIMRKLQKIQDAGHSGMDNVKTTHRY